MTPPLFVSADTAAALLDVDRVTFARLRCTNLLPAPHVIGDALRYDVEELRDFIRAGKARDRRG